MDSLFTLIDRWHRLAARAEDNPNDFDAGKAADEARRALEFRLASLEGFTSGLSAHDSEMGARLRFYLTGK